MQKHTKRQVFGDLFASKNSTLRQSHDKVDFHVLFQYKLRSLRFTTITFASTQLPLNNFQLLFFYFLSRIRLVTQGLI